MERHSERPPSPLSDKRVLLDCRFLGMGGAGRATELLLEGLHRIRPAGRWVLWGPDSLREHLWPGADWHRSDASPTALWGQRAVLRVPGNDVAIYMHQIRPLRPDRSITMIYDTIPLRYGTRSAPRFLKRTYLRTVASVSSRLLTVSRFSRSCIERDLGIAPADIGVVRFPVDRQMVSRVAALRARLDPRPSALYVGRFAPHKNLHRVIAAFERTSFRRQGGELLLVGGSPAEVHQLRDHARRSSMQNIIVEGFCSQGKLEELYATSRLLVLPSLEEGFGLPAWEALCCGLPVCVSDRGSLPEIVGDKATVFAAESLDAIADAIDHCAAQPSLTTSMDGPSVEDYARNFLFEIERIARR